MNQREKQNRFDALREIGCLCCVLNQSRPGLGYGATGQAVEIHHANAGGLHGGKRLGDEYTMPLCLYHHRNVPLPGVSRTAMTLAHGPSWAGGSKPFRAVYGYDADLLDRTNRLIERPEAA